MNLTAILAGLHTTRVAHPRMGIDVTEITTAGAPRLAVLITIGDDRGVLRRMTITDGSTRDSVEVTTARLARHARDWTATDYATCAHVSTIGDVVETWVA